MPATWVRPWLMNACACCIILSVSVLGLGFVPCYESGLETGLRQSHKHGQFNVATRFKGGASNDHRASPATVASRGVGGIVGFRHTDREQEKCVQRPASRSLRGTVVARERGGAEPLTHTKDRGNELGWVITSETHKILLGVQHSDSFMNLTGIFRRAKH